MFTLSNSFGGAVFSILTGPERWIRLSPCQFPRAAFPGPGGCAAAAHVMNDGMAMMAPVFKMKFEIT